MTTEKQELVSGILAGLLMAASTVGLSVLLPNTPALHILTVIIVPYCVAIAVTSNALNALSLVWLNEAFFGVGGVWVQAGPLPGRGLLLALALALFLLTQRHHLVKRPAVTKRSLIILFYALLLPALLLGYSVAFKGNKVGGAVGDVLRFSTILIYFPLRRLLRSKFNIFLGWVSSASVILAFLIIALALAPPEVKRLFLDKWIFAFSAADISDVYSFSSVNAGRAFLAPIIFCFIGIFVGLISVIDRSNRMSARLAAAFLLLASSSTFVASFARGPIASIVLTSILLALFMIMHGQIRSGSLILIALTALAIAGYYMTIEYLPDALAKWDIRGQALVDVLDNTRIEQTRLMVAEWLESPILGKGVGAPVRGYSRTGEDEGLAFEVQYPMVLYRTGIVGFMIIMTPFCWVFIRLWRRFRIYPECLATCEGKFLLASASAILSLLLVSASNPFLATSMTPIFLAFFMGADSSLAQKFRAQCTSFPIAQH